MNYSINQTDTGQTMVFINNQPFAELLDHSDDVVNSLKDKNVRFLEIEIEGLKFYMDSSETWVRRNMYFVSILQVFEPSIKELSFDLCAGQYLALLDAGDLAEQLFPINNNQKIKITGASMTKPGDLFFVSNYVVSADAIANEVGLGRSHYKTETDIGGKTLAILDSNKIIVKRLAHLSNGFGDGRYTIRFENGNLVRNFADNEN